MQNRLIFITHDDRDCTYSIAFRFDYAVKDAVKNIPTARWNPDRKVWTVDDDLGLALKDELEPWAAFVKWVCPEPQRQSYSFPFGTSPVPTTMPDPFAAVFAAVGDERRDAVFRALSKVLHPDVATGDTELMRQLLDARKTA
ncbi:hypothetical protein [Mycolicibacter arupensis]|uniref:Uncharacterized protein n=1 Tax=Mycolicibacter arupensis TaxID=342002 RepID=A0A5C7Y2B6_9MYCO|nr:hypothetical protein [Mycolicibacter arupensis]TXI55920.1 MAG: hypothetical protein E6Q54_11880 [Mycolicibacter arupensis]